MDKQWWRADVGRKAIGVVGAVGFGVGAMLALRSDAATTLLVVSTVLLLAAFFGDRIDTVRLKVGENEFNTALRSSGTAAVETIADTANDALEKAESAGNADAARVILGEGRLRVDQMRDAWLTVLEHLDSQSETDRDPRDATFLLNAIHHRSRSGGETNEDLAEYVAREFNKPLVEKALRMSKNRTVRVILRQALELLD